MCTYPETKLEHGNQEKACLVTEKEDGSGQWRWEGSSGRAWRNGRATIYRGPMGHSVEPPVAIVDTYSLSHHIVIICLLSVSPLDHDFMGA